MPALKNCENCGDYFIASEGIYSSRFRIGLCNHCIDGSVLCKAIKELLPTPDPDTGLVRCGCGSKAEYMHSYPFCNGGLWGVYCADDKMLGCYVHSDMTADDRGSGANVGMCRTKEEARKNWNRAMGVKGADE